MIAPFSTREPSLTLSMANRPESRRDSRFGASDHVSVRHDGDRSACTGSYRFFTADVVETVTTCTGNRAAPLQDEKERHQMKTAAPVSHNTRPSAA